MLISVKLQIALVIYLIKMSKFLCLYFCQFSTVLSPSFLYQSLQFFYSFITDGPLSTQQFILLFQLLNFSPTQKRTYFCNKGGFRFRFDNLQLFRIDFSFYLL